MLILGAVLALQVVGGSPAPLPAKPVTDSALDSTSTRTRGGRISRRLPVTAEALATAFRDAAARPLLMRARVARLAQDSALFAYDATSYQRAWAGINAGRGDRDRLLYGSESVARVRWQLGVGAWVDVKGARKVIPLDEKEARDELVDDLAEEFMSPVPYYPGMESLWIGGGTAKAQVDESDVVHPIATGAEAYYTYETGDSMSFRLPNGATIQLRELRVRPRNPKWNLAVGSLWFDNVSGQLVRAAYRLAVPADIRVAGTDSADSARTKKGRGWLKGLLLPPITMEVSAIAVEYGLHKGRFWLPRIRAVEGGGQVGPMRIPMRIQQRFDYASVNVRDTLPAFVVDTTRINLDSLTPRQRRAWRDSVRAARRAPCAHSDHYVITAVREGDVPVPIAVNVPCDHSKLENSPELPTSIYDSWEEPFGAKELDELVAEALPLGAQPRLAIGDLPPPLVSYGLHLMRYNRVEGFSPGVQIDQQLGGGYSARLIARLGFADLEPNVDLTLTRTNLSRSIYVGGYNHLVSSNDWGRPFTFGRSLRAALFGRDEGFYHRATGAELGWTRETLFGRGADLEWRLFAERQRTAKTNLRSAVNGSRYIANIVAAEAMYVGAGLRLSHSYGLDPRGLRVLSDLRVEAARGDSIYGRAALDLTTSHGLGPLAGALTLSGGSSIGGLPPQRRWFLGGSQTIRGQSADTAYSGNAYWFARAELGPGWLVARPTLFGDVGWVGDRSKLRQVGRPMSGVGAGLSIMDGLIRFDVARGIHPRKQWRLEFHLGARF